MPGQQFLSHAVAVIVGEQVHWLLDIQVMAQNGAAELIAIEPQILAGAKAMIAGVTRSAQGMGGALAWPALLRKLDKLDPGYKL